MGWRRRNPRPAGQETSPAHSSLPRASPAPARHRRWFCHWVVLWFGGSVIWWHWFLAKLWATNFSCPALPHALSFWDTPGYLKQVNNNYRLQFQPVCCSWDRSSNWDFPVNSHFVSSPKPSVWNVLFYTFSTPILALRISMPREAHSALKPGDRNQIKAPLTTSYPHCPLLVHD